MRGIATSHCTYRLSPGYGTDFTADLGSGDVPLVGQPKAPIRGLLAFLVATFLCTVAHAQANEAPPPYKEGEGWPWRNFRAFDFVEPLLPVSAWRAGDSGRVALATVLPATVLASAFVFRSSDASTLGEISRWDWAGIDENQNNVPFEMGMVGLSIAGIFLPAPASRDGQGWSLRTDRATVLALGYAMTQIEVEVLKRVIRRPRPDDPGNRESRPSGHAAVGGAAAAFVSNVLRDALRPREEPNVGIRLAKETASALPYLGAAYLSLERVHAHEHFLTDTLLGSAIGAFTMHVLYAWSFTREEEDRGWIDAAWIDYDPELGAAKIMVSKSF